MNNKNINDIKFRLDNQYQLYKEASSKFNNKRLEIIGCLNCISTSNDENEVTSCCKLLINNLIAEYVVLSRNSYREWIIYNDLFHEYMKFKKI